MLHKYNLEKLEVGGRRGAKSGEVFYWWRLQAQVGGRRWEIGEGGGGGEVFFQVGGRRAEVDVKERKNFFLETPPMNVFFSTNRQNKV